MAARKLKSNVHVVVEVDGAPVATMYGPDFPENGDPPEGAITNPAVEWDDDKDKDEDESSRSTKSARK